MRSSRGTNLFIYSHVYNVYSQVLWPIIRSHVVFHTSSTRASYHEGVFARCAVVMATGSPTPQQVRSIDFICTGRETNSILCNTNINNIEESIKVEYIVGVSYFHCKLWYCKRLDRRHWIETDSFVCGFSSEYFSWRVLIIIGYNIFLLCVYYSLFSCIYSLYRYKLACINYYSLSRILHLPHFSLPKEEAWHHSPVEFNRFFFYLFIILIIYNRFYHLLLFA